MNKFTSKFVTAFLAVFMCFYLPSCSPSTNGQFYSSQMVLDPPVETIIQEEKVVEDILRPDIISELTTKEIYLRELYATEEAVSEFLIQDERVEEVLSVTSIYVPQNHIEDFSKHSQVSQLIDKVDLAPVLTKIAVGTGIILTLAILNVAHLEGPVASIVAAAAPEALKGAITGMGVGTLIGSLTGAADGADSSGRVQSVVRFALAVAGVVISALFLVAAIPAGGTTIPSALIGAKIAISAVFLAEGVVGAGFSTANLIKSFSATDCKDINWDNIDWEKVGEGAAIKAIQGAANGYLWGSITGAVLGGAAGYDSYNKHVAPYSSYEDRLSHTPAKDGSGRGHWTGERGESDFVLDKPIQLKDGTSVSKITYKNGVPDFSKYAKAQINIDNMTNSRDLNFKQADELLAKYWSKIKYGGKTWTPRDVSNFRTDNGYTWHEMNNMKTMQLVPGEVNGTWGHLGGVGEYNIFTDLTGGSEFD